MDYTAYNALVASTITTVSDREVLDTMNSSTSGTAQEIAEAEAVRRGLIKEDNYWENI